MAEEKVYSSITELVGHTPLVELENYEHKHALKARILAKLEYFNPSGSVKDRIALSMIEAGESRGDIKPGDTLIDFTSGNTGIGLAAISNAKGYHFVAVIQPGVSVERAQILKAYGATLLQFSDIPGLNELIAEKGMILTSLYELIGKYADAHGYYYINQGFNRENPLAHYRGTGPEIWQATNGQVDYAVALVGTAGTLVGIGKYLREVNPDIKIIGAQPAPSSRKDASDPDRNTIDGVLAFHNVPKNSIPGFFADFKVEPDEVLDLDADEAYAMGREIVRTDGLFLGQSSAAAILAATKIAQRPEAKGKSIVAICADNAFKYLSTNIYK